MDLIQTVQSFSILDSHNNIDKNKIVEYIKYIIQNNLTSHTISLDNNKKYLDFFNKLLNFLYFINFFKNNIQEIDELKTNNIKIKTLLLTYQWLIKFQILFIKYLNQDQKQQLFFKYIPALSKLNTDSFNKKLNKTQLKDIKNTNNLILLSNIFDENDINFYINIFIEIFISEKYKEEVNRTKTINIIILIESMIEFGKYLVAHVFFNKIYNDSYIISFIDKSNNIISIQYKNNTKKIIWLFIFNLYNFLYYIKSNKQIPIDFIFNKFMIKNNSNFENEIKITFENIIENNSINAIICTEICNLTINFINTIELCPYKFEFIFRKNVNYGNNNITPFINLIGIIYIIICILDTINNKLEENIARLTDFTDFLYNNRQYNETHIFNHFNLIILEDEKRQYFIDKFINDFDNFLNLVKNIIYYKCIKLIENYELILLLLPFYKNYFELNDNEKKLLNDYNIISNNENNNYEYIVYNDDDDDNYKKVIFYNWIQDKDEFIRVKDFYINLKNEIYSNYNIVDDIKNTDDFKKILDIFYLFYNLNNIILY